MNDVFILSNKKVENIEIVNNIGFIIEKILLNLSKDLPILIKSNNLNDMQNLIECKNSHFLLVIFDLSFLKDDEFMKLWNEFSYIQKKENIIPILIEKISKEGLSIHQKSIIDELQNLKNSLDLSEIKFDIEIDKKIKQEITYKLVETWQYIKTQLIDIRSKKNVHTIGTINKNTNESDLEGLRTKAADTPKMFKSYLPVCAIYTGGTVGMIHENDGVTLRQAEVEELINHIPHLTKLQFDVHFYSYTPTIDSSNIKSDQWKALALFIEALHSIYQGFVIIHGVNTMAYTASALSFLLENVSMPIILTGAEYPLTDFGSDAAQNVVNALNVAGYKSNKYAEIRGISILFGKKIFRGNRATKKISLDPAEGFYSPNYPTLANITNDRIDGYNVTIQKKEQSSEAIKYNANMAEYGGVIICDIYPDMDLDIFKVMCTSETKALIIRTYGTGGVPDEEPTFMSHIKDLLKKKVVVISLTQCPIGEVEYRLFETNAKLFYMGVVNGGDMITEAAYCKVKHLLAEYDECKGYSLDRRFDLISEKMSTNLKGEMSINTYVIRPIRFSENNSFVPITPDNPSRPQVQLPKKLKEQIICSAIIRLDVEQINDGELTDNADILIVIDGMGEFIGEYKQKFQIKEVGNEHDVEYPISINITENLRKYIDNPVFRDTFNLKITSKKHSIIIRSLNIVISARIADGEEVSSDK